MKQLIIPMVLFLSFEFLLSVVTVYLPCKKRRYFKLQIIWTRLIIFFCKCYLVLSIHFSYRFNCCAGYILDINKSICVGKYKFYFNTMQFKIIPVLHLYVSPHLECSVGYIGPRCQTTCPFPSYGIFCRNYCNCHQSECDHIKGCVTGKVFVF